MEESMRFRIFADFNRKTRDDKGDRIYIAKEGTRQLKEFSLIKELEHGSHIYLFDGEMIVEAIAEFDDLNRTWYGRPNWSTLRELSSRADGINEYRNATAEQRLAILHYEVGNILGGIQGCIEILENKDLIKDEKIPGIYGKLVSDLSGFLEDLNNIIGELTQ